MSAQLRHVEPSQVCTESKDILISIITVAFRARHELLSVIESVQRLKDSRTEFIVIDGGSEDGTRELLAEHDSVIDYWLSEPDRGIYDAMNKGIATAHGRFLLHLNAGDALLALPTEELDSLPDTVDIAAFRVLVNEREFRPLRGFALRLNNTLHHQGTFFRRERFLQYDTSYRIFADFDVNQRMALAGVQIRLFDRIVASHSEGGVSDVASKAAVSEFFQIIRSNYGSAYLLPAWILCKWRGLAGRVRQLHLSLAPRR